MRKLVGLLSLAGSLGLLATANAQAPPPSTANAAFDGRYAFVSSTKVNETYTGHASRYKECHDRKAGPLTVVNGRAHYRSGLQLEGTVGVQGGLTMRAVGAPARGGGIYDLTLDGRIDGAGTVHARQTGYNCVYDFVWQKVSK